ncbi:MAG: EFR1 family ferrodoxin, partial [Candidatus Weimeria sp.]
MIFYFSSTGNDKYVAARIAGSTDDTVYSISECMRSGNFSYTLKEEENFGLVIPTYFGGFPNIVIDFLEKLDIQWADRNYVFFVGTYSANYGNIGSEAFRRLEKLGRKPDAAFMIKMVDNWNPFFDMTDKKYIAKAEENAESEISETVRKITAHQKTDAPKNNTPAAIQA